jgi:hypothetical protein
LENLENENTKLCKKIINRKKGAAREVHTPRLVGLVGFIKALHGLIGDDNRNAVALRQTLEEAGDL